MGPLGRGHDSRHLGGLGWWRSMHRRCGWGAGAGACGAAAWGRGRHQALHCSSFGPGGPKLRLAIRAGPRRQPPSLACAGAGGPPPHGARQWASAGCSYAAGAVGRGSGAALHPLRDTAQRGDGEWCPAWPADAGGRYVLRSWPWEGGSWAGVELGRALAALMAPWPALTLLGGGSSLAVWLSGWGWARLGRSPLCEVAGSGALGFEPAGWRAGLARAGSAAPLGDGVWDGVAPWVGCVLLSPRTGCCREPLARGGWASGPFSLSVPRFCRGAMLAHSRGLGAGGAFGFWFWARSAWVGWIGCLWLARLVAFGGALCLGAGAAGVAEGLALVRAV